MIHALFISISILFSSVFFLFGAYRLFLLYHWLRLRRITNGKRPFDNGALFQYPFVTVQVPLFNEQFVAKRIIEAASHLDWPKDRLEIQILDDSTDNTRNIVDKVVDTIRARGVDIYVIRRKRRKGFKAGALSHGLFMSKGDFIAIFDADFVPAPNFLKAVLPYFSHERIGLIQARWGFLNEGYSIITKIQAMFLRFHFGVEQYVRQNLGLFLNFNGTAGVWRKKTIEDAGGWQTDTVTEDLDLSIRAQLKGWKFLYVDHVVVESELPITLSALRQQQTRWAKGSMQTLKKLVRPLWRSSISWRQKVHATLLLISNCGWPAGLMTFLTFYFVLNSLEGVCLNIYLILLYFSCSAVFLSFYLVEVKSGRTRPIDLAANLMAIPITGLVLAPFISISILKGLFKSGGEFIRTPKFGIIGKKYDAVKFPYHSSQLCPIFVDIILTLYFMMCVLYFNLPVPFVIFLVFVIIGMVAVLCFDLKEFVFARLREKD